AVDGGGNAYTTGYFVGNADFDPGPGTYNFDAGNIDMPYISKLDSNGNLAAAAVLVANGPNSGDIGYHIAIGTDASVYTCGAFSDTIDFDPGSGTFDLTG